MFESLICGLMWKKILQFYCGKSVVIQLRCIASFNPLNTLLFSLNVQQSCFLTSVSDFFFS